MKLRFDGFTAVFSRGMDGQWACELLDVGMEAQGSGSTPTSALRDALKEITKDDRL